MAVLLSASVEKAHRETLAKDQLPVSKFVRMVNPSSLSVGQKQKLWRGIKCKNPELAEMLTSDPNIAALKLAFDAQVVFTVDEIHQYMGEK